MIRFAIAAALILATAAHAQTAAPPLLEAVFVKDYSKYEGGALGPVGPYFPIDAVGAQRQGAAVIQCHLLPSGRLKGCTTVSETRHWLHFGDAARKMAEDGVITAALPGGAPASDTLVQIRVPFAVAGWRQ